MNGPVLITGGRGFLGSRLDASLRSAGHQVISGHDGPDGRADFEIPGAAGDLIRRHRPRAIVHAGALSAIADCESDRERARRINVAATAEIAEAAQSLGARLIFLSTDQVWSGDAAPYRGDEFPTPLHVYGATKAEAEAALLAAGGSSVILRLALVFGRSPSGRRSASEMILRAAEEKRELGLFEDEWRQPVSAGQVVSILERLLDHDLEGRFALAGPEALTRLAFGQRVIEALGLEGPAIRSVRAADLGLTPPRPADLRADGTRLAQELGIELNPLDDEIRREHS